MNTQNAINDIHALVANGEVNDSVAEKLLAIAYWLEAELEDDREDDGRLCERSGCGRIITDANYAYGWCPECCGGGKCSHGERPEDCNECAKESDRAYDELHGW